MAEVYVCACPEQGKTPPACSLCTWCYTPADMCMCLCLVLLNAVPICTVFMQVMSYEAVLQIQLVWIYMQQHFTAPVTQLSP